MALQGFWNFSKSIAVAIYAATMIAPLKRLYFEGPRFYGYGFWKGAAEHDICAALTNHDSNFWMAHSDACKEIIEKDFHSIVVLVETVGYFALFYIFLGIVIKRLATRQSTLAEQEVS